MFSLLCYASCSVTERKSREMHSWFNQLRKSIPNQVNFKISDYSANNQTPSLELVGNISIPNRVKVQVDIQHPKLSITYPLFNDLDYKTFVGSLFGSIYGITVPSIILEITSFMIFIISIVNCATNKCINKKLIINDVCFVISIVAVFCGAITIFVSLDAFRTSSIDKIKNTISETATTVENMLDGIIRNSQTYINPLINNFTETFNRLNSTYIKEVELFQNLQFGIYSNMHHLIDTVNSRYSSELSKLRNVIEGEGIHVSYDSFYSFESTFSGYNYYIQDIEDYAQLAHTQMYNDQKHLNNFKKDYDLLFKLNKDWASEVKINGKTIYEEKNDIVSNIKDANTDIPNISSAITKGIEAYIATCGVLIIICVIWYSIAMFSGKRVGGTTKCNCVLPFFIIFFMFTIVIACSYAGCCLSPIIQSYDVSIDKMISNIIGMLYDRKIGFYGTDFEWTDGYVHGYLRSTFFKFMDTNYYSNMKNYPQSSSIWESFNLSNTFNFTNLENNLHQIIKQSISEYETFGWVRSIINQLSKIEEYAPYNYDTLDDEIKYENAFTSFKQQITNPPENVTNAINEFHSFFVDNLENSYLLDHKYQIENIKNLSTTHKRIFDEEFISIYKTIDNIIPDILNIKQIFSETKTGDVLSFSYNIKNVIIDYNWLFSLISCGGIVISISFVFVVLTMTIRNKENDNEKEDESLKSKVDMTSLI